MSGSEMEKLRYFNALLRSYIIQLTYTHCTGFIDWKFSGAHCHDKLQNQRRCKWCNPHKFHWLKKVNCLQITIRALALVIWKKLKLINNDIYLFYNPPQSFSLLVGIFCNQNSKQMNFCVCTMHLGNTVKAGCTCCLTTLLAERI